MNRRGWVRDVRSFIYGLKAGIRNLWEYRRIIWEDRDWDWAYLYDLMAFKMKRMADYQEKHGWSVDSERYARELRTGAELLKRIMEDNYHEETENYEEAIEMQHKDLKEFCMLFKNRSLSWWD